MKNSTKNMSRRSNMPRLPKKQDGAVLVITIFVLMALTVVALAVTNGNQSQAIMVRNNQFRLEAFNASYAEIDAQVDVLNERALSDGVPIYLVRLIDGEIGGEVSSDATAGTPEYLEKLSASSDTTIDADVATEFRGDCTIFGQQIGVGEEKIQCNELKIESNVQLNNTSVASFQNQVYEYNTLK